MLCLLWCVCYGVFVMVCLLWCACYGVLVMVCLLWCACYGVFVMVCLLWCVCYVVFVMLCLLWCVCYVVFVMLCLLCCVCCSLKSHIKQVLILIKTRLHYIITFVSSFTIPKSESPRCLNSEETEQMYSKNLSVLSIFGQTTSCLVF